MRIKNYLLTGMLALGAVLTGCSKDDLAGEGNPEDGKASMAIQLAGSSSTRAVTSDQDPDDSKIHDFKVYVFSYIGGGIEDEAVIKVEADDTEYVAKFDELSTKTSKRVVVLTNLGVGNYPDVTNYSMLKDATKTNLDDQTPTLVNQNGYMMSGEHDGAITLTPNATKSINVPVKRVLAKISLQSITIDPESQDELDGYEILGVSMQRVTPDASLAPITPYYDTYHYGGYATSDPQMEQKSYLVDALALGQIPYTKGAKFNLKNYFVVFPNDQPDNCTLLTIKAKYNGEDLYYPVKVNFKETTNENTTGGLVESNKHYKLNITLKNISDGTTDPEVPAEDATLEVKITVEEWEVITQNEIW